MTTGFENPITGGQGSLVRAQIKSPNFSLAGQTGWAIMKNGNAYFFNIVAKGTVTATAFIGTDFLMSAAGLFYYNGTPAAGNLVAAIAPPGTTQDSFGNAVSPVVQIGSGAGPRLTIDQFGNVNVFNASGDNVGQWEVGDGSMRFYSSTGPAPGSLAVAVSPAAGTDGNSNKYYKGLTVYGANNATPTGISLPTGNADEVLPGAVQSGVVNPGAAGEYQFIQMVNPEMTGASESDFVLCALKGSTKATASSAQGLLQYVSTTGVTTFSLTWTANGVFIQPPLVLNNLAATPATSTNGPSLYGAGGQAKYVDASGSNWNTGQKTFWTTSTQTISLAAQTTITGLASGTLPVGTYHIRAVIGFVGVAADDAYLTFAGTAVTSFFAANITYVGGNTNAAATWGTNAAMRTQNTLGNNSNLETGVLVANDQYTAFLEGIVTISTAGTITVVGATSANTVSTFTTEAGAVLIIEPVNNTI